MKIKTTILFAAFVALTLQGKIAVTSGLVEIYPTGDSTEDVSRIQTAVDDFAAAQRDGVILLKAHNTDGVPTAFNFDSESEPEQRGSVLIDGAPAGGISFIGEVFNGVQTAIVGGNKPIHMVRHDRLFVRDIEFRGAFLHAIFVQAANEVVIRNNVFLNTVGFEEFFNDDNPSGINPLTRVIYLEGLNFDPNQITDKIVIVDNIIDTAMAGFTDGIALFWTNAKTWIANNQIAGVNFAIRQDNYGQPVYIVANDLMGLVPMPQFVGIGVGVGCGLGDSAYAIVVDNDISVEDNQGGSAAGIASAGGDLFGPDCSLMGSMVARNHVHLINGFAGIELVAFSVGLGDAQVSDNVIRKNTFSGDALFGILVGGFKDPQAAPEITIQTTNNAVLRNDFSQLETAESDIFFDGFTNNNVAAVRDRDTVTNEGIDNLVFIN